MDHHSSTGGWPVPPSSPRAGDHGESAAPVVLEFGPPAGPTRRLRPPVVVAVCLGVLLVLSGFAVHLSRGGDRDGVREPAGVAAPVSPPAAVPTAAPPPPVAVPTTGPAAMAVGRDLVVSWSDAEMRVTVTGTATRRAGCGRRGIPAQGVYLLVDVQFRVVTGTGQVDPALFRHRSPATPDRSSVSGVSSGCEKPLSAGTRLGPGARATVRLVFDVRVPTGQVCYGQPGESDPPCWQVP